MASEKSSLALGRLIFVDGFESTTRTCRNWMTKATGGLGPPLPSLVDFSYESSTQPYGKKDTNESVFIEREVLAAHITSTNSPVAIVAYSLGAVIAALTTASMLRQTDARPNVLGIMFIAPPFTPHPAMARIFRLRRELPVPIRELLSNENGVADELRTSLVTILEKIPKFALWYSEHDRYCPFEPARLGEQLGREIANRSYELGIERRSRKGPIDFHKRLRNHPATLRAIRSFVTSL